MRISLKFKLLLGLLIVLAIGVLIWDFYPTLNKQPELEPLSTGSFNMSPNDIRTLHSDTPLVARNTGNQTYLLSYDRVLAGYPATLNYVFQERGLVFKQYRLEFVTCEFELDDLAIIEWQELADRVQALIIPYYRASEYESFGFTIENLQNEAHWFYNATFLNQSTHMGIFGIKSKGVQQLTVFILKKSKFDNAADVSHEIALDNINSNRNNNEPFDYDKWRNVSATTKNLIDDK